MVVNDIKREARVEKGYQERINEKKKTESVIEDSRMEYDWSHGMPLIGVESKEETSLKKDGRIDGENQRWTILRSIITRADKGRSRWNAFDSEKK